MLDRESRPVAGWSEWTSAARFSPIEFLPQHSEPHRGQAWAKGEFHSTGVPVPKAKGLVSAQEKKRQLRPNQGRERKRSDS